MADWFDTGYESTANEEKRRDDAANAVRRFWLKKGTSKNIIFLDDFSKKRTVTLPDGSVVERPIVPFTFNEHQMTVDGEWRSYYTCIARSDGPCPACAAGHKAAFMGMFTILEEYENKDGKKVWAKRILPAKLKTLQLIRTQTERRGGQLQYARYIVDRTTDQTAPTAGNNFDFDCMMTVDEIKALLPEKVTIEPVNFMETLSPLPNAELTMLMGSGRVAPPKTYDNKQTNAPTNFNASGGSSAEKGNTADFNDTEDDIPF